MPIEVYGFTSQKRMSDNDREAEEIGLFPWPFEGLDSRLEKMSYQMSFKKN